MIVTSASEHMHKPDASAEPDKRVAPSVTTEQSQLTLLLASLSARISLLEGSKDKSLLKQLTENAGVAALVLGLVLTLTSLYDVFVTKPDADRIASITQFNQAVNAAAKLRQDLAQMQSTVTGQRVQLAIVSAATPQILSNISTARAVLPSLKDVDVGIPELIVLISEAITSGDLEGASQFAARAALKTDAPPILKAEAKRYQARVLFLTGDAVHGRAAYEEALTLLGNAPLTAPSRAYDLADWAIYEATIGDCGVAHTAVNRLAQTLSVPTVTMDAREQLTQTLVSQLSQFQTRCVELQDVRSELANPISRPQSAVHK